MARSKLPLEERFWARVQIGAPEDCWLWQGTRKDSGYGTFSVDGRSRAAQQVAWELRNGKPWPKGLDSCHTCDNRPCVNPDHIIPGTREFNVLDMFSKGRQAGPTADNLAKTHCCNGHPLSGANLRTRMRRDPGAKKVRAERVCRACHNEYVKNWTKARAVAAFKKSEVGHE